MFILESLLLKRARLKSKDSMSVMYCSVLFSLVLCVDHVIWTGHRIFKLWLNINCFVVVFLICCETHFGAPLRFRKDWVISLGKLQSNLSYFSNQGVHKKVNKHSKFNANFKIQCLMIWSKNSVQTINYKTRVTSWLRHFTCKGCWSLELVLKKALLVPKCMFPEANELLGTLVFVGVSPDCFFCRK